MTDRIVASAWWLAVMGMIALAAGAGLFFSYRGVLEMLAGRWFEGSRALVVGGTMAAAALLLCRHRNDLL